MSITTPTHSFNSTNLRLAVLTFILFFAVIWTFSLSSSDPTLNLKSPDHDKPITPPTTPVTVPPSTEKEEPASPPPADQKTDSGPNLPPPPELSDLDNPPPSSDPNLDTTEPVASPEGASSDLIQPTTPETVSDSNPATIPPTDELNPLPDPNLEQQKDDGSSSSTSNVNPPPNNDVVEAGQARHRTLILYAYAESEAARANIQYFLKKGLHTTSDFIFILNGETSIASLIPSLPNIRIITRPNTCYDLGAFGEVLRQDDLYKQYTRFITMNASIRGPFFPVWDSKKCWKDAYLNRVTDETKLVGMTLNCGPRPHVQSMILATDQIGISTLLDKEKALEASQDDMFGKSTDLVGFTGCYEGYKQAVHAEIGTTGLIQRAGYKVDVLMTSFHSESTPEEYCKANPESGDVLFNGAYFGSNVHPYETIFIKANRNVDVKLLDKMTEWHLKMEGTSFETCV